jgi:hypothetical protein
MLIARMTGSIKGRSRLLPTLSLLAVLTACQPPVDEVDRDSLENQARELAGRFVSTLQPTLQRAMAEGGAVHAITVCSEQAPRIAEDLTLESGWEVARVSLKPRNTASATPDSWERSVLEQFDQRQQAGEPGSELRAADVVDGEFRYMQAQPAGPLCLTCHGQQIDDEVRSALAEYYPEDTATGYAAGEIRGAISLTREL